MKVGVLQFFSWPDRRVPQHEVYRRALERIDRMEEAGYDCVWLAEHHFQSFSICPSVHMMATAVAARTERIRIGTAVSLAAFYHPLRLAEEVALLDHLSGGRVNWGAGRGFHRGEFEAFGIDPEESADRFREAVDIVLTAWRGGRFDFEGRFHTFRDIEVLPGPLQDPHPPVWLAASSEGSIRRAGKDGFAILMDPHSSHDEIRRKLDLYRSARHEAGHRADAREVPVARLVAVGETSDEAREIARRGARWIVDSYANPGATAPAGPGAFIPFGGEDPVGRYLDGVIVYGTADEVTGELRRLEREIPLESLMIAPLSERSFQRFTDEVLPAISTAAPDSGNREHVPARS